MNLSEMSLWTCNFVIYNFIPLYIGFVVKLLNIVIQAVKTTLDIRGILCSKTLEVWNPDSELIKRIFIFLMDNITEKKN